MENKSIIGIIVAVVAIALVALFIGKGGKKEEVNEVAFNPVLENLVDGSYEFSSGTVNWSAEKKGGSHTGTVDVKKGEVVVKDGNIVTSKVVVDLSTIKNTDGGALNQKLIDHLKSADFFNVAKNPFASLSIKDLKGSNGTALLGLDYSADLPIDTVGSGSELRLSNFTAKQATPETISVNSDFVAKNEDLGIAQSAALKTMLNGDFKVSFDGVFTLKK